MGQPAHQLTMTVLMTPDMANFAGNVHGGTILRLLDQAAYACASRYAGRYVVTLSVDRVTFRQPLRVLWGDRGAANKGNSFVQVWNAWAEHVTGKAVAAGHFVPEEAPAETAADLRAFFLHDIPAA
jgi:pimeloyl-ACP methyl ester carboxylesterase